MRVLLTGGSGTLGRYVLRDPGLADADVAAPSRSALDVGDAASVHAFVRDHRPALVIHAAAVIRSRGANGPEMWAETSRVNVAGTGHVAGAARAAGARLVYVSTDFVFDGAKPGGLYREDDVACPLGYYPLSKYAGERLVAPHPDALVVRMSFNDDAGWPYPKAFSDRFTSKLKASEAASQLVAAALSGLTGVLHVGGPRRSYLDFARTLDPSVEPMTMADVASGHDLMPLDVSLDVSRWRAHRAG